MLPRAGQRDRGGGTERGGAGYQMRLLSCEEDGGEQDGEEQGRQRDEAPGGARLAAARVSGGGPARPA